MSFDTILTLEYYKELLRLDLLRKLGETNAIRLKADYEWGVLNNIRIKAVKRYNPTATGMN